MTTETKVKFLYFRLLRGTHTQAKRNPETGEIIPRETGETVMGKDGPIPRPEIETFRANPREGFFPVVPSTVDLQERFGREKFQRLNAAEVAYALGGDEEEEAVDLSAFTLGQLKRYAQELDIEIPETVPGTKAAIREYLEQVIGS